MLRSILEVLDRNKKQKREEERWECFAFSPKSGTEIRLAELVITSTLSSADHMAISKWVFKTVQKEEFLLFN